ncbi:DUF1259 domain-containing protein [Planococcus glaciei]|uniref:DUF1259 domain-containing protein n=1 Tax=Planococcus glaciei TaxID=459472 RepID=UPI001C72DCB2|nr:DUF1259 domain-containing protein [Planococcus glaciei]MBX0314125.1 DUF1259 domain-containing protein [Planococcus glaciei]
MQKVEMNQVPAKVNVAQILKGNIEEQAGKFYIVKKRIIEISVENHAFTCMLEHDISFEGVLKDGYALNKAEIFLLPEEYPAFFSALSGHTIPFPVQYRQWQRVNPHIISVCMESIEPPEDFAKRLATALQIIEKFSCPVKK